MLFKFWALVVFAAAVLGYAQAMPTPDEEHYLDKEFNRDLVTWLKSFQYAVPQYGQYGAPAHQPCRYYGPNSISFMPKRNSELINSLLSLPKSMNDAGRK